MELLPCTDSGTADMLGKARKRTDETKRCNNQPVRARNMGLGTDGCHRVVRGGQREDTEAINENNQTTIRRTTTAHQGRGGGGGGYIVRSCDDSWKGEWRVVSAKLKEH